MCIRDSFSTVLDSVRYADDMQAEVVHAGGTVLAASPPSAGVRSRAQPDSPFMQHRACLLYTSRCV